MRQPHTAKTLSVDLVLARKKTGDEEIKRIMAAISVLLCLVLMGRTYADDREAVWMAPSVASAYNSLTPPFAGGLEQSSQRLEGQPEETAAQAITIYLSSAHKGAVMALLEAVDQGTTMTGLADFDSLSLNYGLWRLGIGKVARKRLGIGSVPRFYKYSFRLAFPPSADAATVAGAYWNLPYVNSTEPKPPSDMLSRKRRDIESDAKYKKLATGVLGGLGLVGAAVFEKYAGDDPGSPFIGFWGGNLAGTAIGVSAVDPQDNFLITLAGSALFGAGVPLVITIISVETYSENGGILAVLSGFLGPIVGAMLASEVGRKPLSAKL